jgi:Tfp pilus assembly protein PilX
MARHHRRGSALLTTLIFLMVMFTLGAALLSLTHSNLTRSERDMLRAQALDVAEAGVEKAIYYLRNTSPVNSGSNTGTTDGSASGYTNGSWRTAGWTETLTSNGSYTFSVQDGTGVDAGKLVILCTGTATTGTKSVSRRLRVLITRVEENISPWNNVIFGGVGQAGKSINGNVVMRGGIHLLGDGEPYTDTDGDGHWDDAETYTDTNGNGQYDIGEPFTDTDGDGHRDAREPFTDMNGNGVCDPPLTVTDLAEQMDGTANVGNNYDIMPSDLKALIPSCPTVSYGGETVQSLSAKLRVKHGRVDISGTATVGDPNVAGGSPAYKETMTGTYVNDGYGGNQGTANVYSDNGTVKKYDCKDLVQFPDIIATPTSAIHGIVYSNHEAYLSSPFEALQVPGPINLQPDQNYGPVQDAFGNRLYVNGSTGTIEISGIVNVLGNINFNRPSGNGNDTFHYTGRGTLSSTGSIYMHTNLLSAGTFPTTDAMGLIARHNLELATGNGDSQLKMMGAFYAQEQIISQKQNEICGTFVTSYFSMQNVPHMYQVPALSSNLPPGMPGSTPIWIITTQVNSWKEIAPA